MDVVWNIINLFIFAKGKSYRRVQYLCVKFMWHLLYKKLQLWQLLSGPHFNEFGLGNSKKILLDLHIFKFSLGLDLLSFNF